MLNTAQLNAPIEADEDSLPLNLMSPLWTSSLSSSLMAGRLPTDRRSVQSLAVWAEVSVMMTHGSLLTLPPQTPRCPCCVSCESSSEGGKRSSTCLAQQNDPGELHLLQASCGPQLPVHSSPPFSPARTTPIQLDHRSPHLLSRSLHLGLRQTVLAACM